MDKNIKTHSINGEIFRISFNGKQKVNGWLLLVTDEGQEYLIRQNSELFWFKNIKRKIYQTSGSLKEYIVYSNGNKGEIKSYIGVSIAFILSALIRGVIPQQWIWLNNNSNNDIITGLVNMFQLYLFIFIIFFIISLYRKKRFENQLKVIGKNLNLLGNVIYLPITNKKDTNSEKSTKVFVIGSKLYNLNDFKLYKYTNKILISVIKLFGYLFVFVLVSILVILIPFLVQERLFAVITVVVLGFFFFRGDTSSEGKKKEFKILEGAVRK